MTGGRHHDDTLASLYYFLQAFSFCRLTLRERKTRDWFARFMGMDTKGLPL